LYSSILTYDVLNEVAFKPANQSTLGEVYSAVSTGPVEPEVEVDCGEVGEQLDMELKKILYEAEQKTIDYLRQYTISIEVKCI
jgi:Rrf2 family transcriptional repressor of oqxAB